MKDNKVRIVNANQTWAGLLPVFIELLKNGKEEGKIEIEKELYRMAEAADNWNDHVRNQVPSVN